MSRDVITVTGKIDPSDIGACQFHEHIMLSKGKSYETNPLLYMESIGKSSMEVDIYRQAGGRTIIDAQPTLCNRVAAGLRKISENTGVNIICSTGFHKMIFYPEEHPVFSLSQDELARLFISELTLSVKDEEDMGIYTGIRDETDYYETENMPPICAGIVKTALDSCDLTSQYEKLFAAAAIAAMEADRVMMIHVEKESHPLKLMKFLVKLGMKPENMVFCHMDRTIPDMGIHLEVMRAGAYTESDTIGRYKYHSDEKEVEILRSYINSGFEDRMLISLDTTRGRMRSYTSESEVGLDYIFREFIPIMTKMEIDQEIIHKMLYDNPERVLAGM